MLEKKYLLELLKQFHEAVGIKNLREMNDEFLEWMKEYQMVLLQFKDYYEFLGLSIDDWDAYEIGKGCLDSIIIDKTHAISLYGKEKSELYVFDNQPLIISREGTKQIYGSDLFYTYNPYTNKDLEIIRKLSQIGELISISVCGKNYDRNKELKINQLINSFNEFEVKHNYEQNGDNYFYTIYTPRKVKTKNLTK